MMTQKKQFIEPELVKYEGSLDKVTLQPFHDYNGVDSSAKEKKAKKSKK